MATLRSEENHQLRMLFWNARSYRQRQNELQQILIDLDVFICVESKLAEKEIIKHRDFNVYRKDRNCTGRRGKGEAL